MAFLRDIDSFLAFTPNKGGMTIDPGPKMPLSMLKQFPDFSNHIPDKIPKPKNKRLQCIHSLKLNSLLPCGIAFEIELECF